MVWYSPITAGVRRAICGLLFGILAIRISGGECCWSGRRNHSGEIKVRSGCAPRWRPARARICAIFTLPSIGQRGLGLLDHITHELRELVDRLGQLDQTDGVGLLNPLFFIGVPLGIYWLVLAINGLRRERAAWAGRDHGTWP